MANVLTQPQPVSAKPVTAKPVIDYPRQDEKISSGDYTVRINAPSEVKKVEISINQGPWQACRQAVGYWWYDWVGYSNGEHELMARLETNEGRRIGSKAVEFFIDRKQQAKTAAEV